MIHELKILPKYFNDIISGKKSFEIRKKERDYKCGDLLALNEYDDKKKAYTGCSCLVYIDYIIDDPKYCKENFVVMGIKPIKIEHYKCPCHSLQITQKTESKF